MQILKEEVKLEILQSARREFMEHGFRSASLRKIATGAGITVGNIYRYFKNKDALLRELLTPVVGSIEMMKLGLKHHSRDDQGADHEAEEHGKMVKVVYDFINSHRDDLKLLLFKTGGSSMENYEEELIGWYADLYYKNLLESSNMLGIKDFKIEKVTLHLIAKSVADSLKACLEQDMPFEAVQNVAEEMFAFYGGGSKELVLSKRES